MLPPNRFDFISSTEFLERIILFKILLSLRCVQEISYTAQLSVIHFH
jgi:hypothetical protein